ncbi:MAG: tyrosine-type recombinase/integrase, partial [Terriglobales bacterium]
AKGERQRERVLTDSEVDAYLSACKQPWRDIATLILGTGMRPGEAKSLRWENITLEGTPMLRITEGKTNAARRSLPMLPAVQCAMRNRWIEQGQPREGWVFPSDSPDGHLMADGTWHLHHAAVKASGVKPFEPYIMRHTALTNLAAAGADAFTLARIAGHSSITITQRYCHPQADAIARAFGQFGANRLEVVTKGGYQTDNEAPAAALAHTA